MPLVRSVGRSVHANRDRYAVPFDRVRHRGSLPAPAHRLIQQQRWRGADAVALLELPADDDAVFVQVEYAGVGHAELVGPCLPAIEPRLLGEMLVVQAESPDHVAAFIGE